MNRNSLSRKSNATHHSHQYPVSLSCKDNRHINSGAHCTLGFYPHLLITSAVTRIPQVQMLELQDFRASISKCNRWQKNHVSWHMTNLPSSGPKAHVLHHKQNAFHRIPTSANVLSHPSINSDSKISPKYHLRQPEEWVVYGFPGDHFLSICELVIVSWNAALTKARSRHPSHSTREQLEVATQLPSKSKHYSGNSIKLYDSSPVPVGFLVIPLGPWDWKRKVCSRDSEQVLCDSDWSLASPTCCSSGNIPLPLSLPVLAPFHSSQKCFCWYKKF